MNYGKQAILRGTLRVRSDGPTCAEELVNERGSVVEGAEGRPAAKSVVGGTTNQIFAPAARSRGPLLLFICKAGLNYGKGKEARRILRPESDHCTTC